MKPLKTQVSWRQITEHPVTPSKQVGIHRFALIIPFRTRFEPVESCSFMGYHQSKNSHLLYHEYHTRRRRRRMTFLAQQSRTSISPYGLLTYPGHFPIPSRDIYIMRKSNVQKQCAEIHTNTTLLYAKTYAAKSVTRKVNVNLNQFYLYYN